MGVVGRSNDTVHLPGRLQGRCSRTNMPARPSARAGCRSPTHHDSFVVSLTFTTAAAKISSSSGGTVRTQDIGPG